MTTANDHLSAVFKWYIEHGFEATPINPKAEKVEIIGQPPHDAIHDLSALSNPTETSLSIVTRPEITLDTLRTAKKLGIQRVWFQTGSYDDKVLDFARGNFKAVVAGIPGSNAIPHGWCILVHGESAASAAGRKLKL